MNIRPQEVTENGERSVQYKGSDGKFHSVAPSGGGNADSSVIVNISYATDHEKIVTEQEVMTLLNAALAGKTIVFVYDSIWAPANDKRIAYVLRVSGFTIVDGSITIGDSLVFGVGLQCGFADLMDVAYENKGDGTFSIYLTFNK